MEHISSLAEFNRNRDREVKRVKRIVKKAIKTSADFCKKFEVYKKLELDKNRADLFVIHFARYLIVKDDKKLTDKNNIAYGQAAKVLEKKTETYSQKIKMSLDPTIPLEKFNSLSKVVSDANILSTAYIRYKNDKPKDLDNMINYTIDTQLNKEDSWDMPIRPTRHSETAHPRM